MIIPVIKMILVVEDDVNINQVVCEYLKDAGFAVVSHLDGEKAKEFIESGAKIDLCIFDIMLPGISGLELLKIVREQESLAQVPIMMLTALSDEQTQIASFDSLADDYVTKPFSPKILVKRAVALLRRSVGGSGTLRFGDLEIDLQRYVVTDQGETVKLTLKEFELLKTLVSSPRKVLSRPRLLEQVWGYDYFGDDRIVDAHIKNLRRKLKSELIQTVKGVGYKADEKI
jgi:DNA-binding response OmpR family regulator